MPAIITERPESRPFDVGPDTGERHLLYNVTGTTDEVEVETLVKATIPAFYGGLDFQNYTVSPDGVPDIWKVDAKYGLKIKKKPGEWSMAFDTSGATQKITQSRLTIDRRLTTLPIPPGEIPPDYEGAINVTQDSVDGCDVVISAFRYEETHVATDADITADWVRLVRLLTGRTNDAPFRIFGTGEVLFLGVSGSKRFNDNWELTFKFDVGTNVTLETEPPLRIGDLPDPTDPSTRITKMAWEYLWVRYVDNVNANCKIKKPHSVYIEQIYLDGHFDDMFKWLPPSNGVWKFAGHTSPPANGTFVTDAPAFVDVAVLDVAKLDADGIDLSELFGQLVVGDTIRIEELDNPLHFVEYTLTSPPVNMTTFFTLAVSFSTGSAVTPASGVDCRISVPPH